MLMQIDAFPASDGARCCHCNTVLIQFTVPLSAGLLKRAVLRVPDHIVEAYYIALQLGATNWAQLGGHLSQLGCDK